MSPWTCLGLEPTRDTVAIKRAYARALKRCRPDDDAAAYQHLRESYEWALAWAHQTAEDEHGEANVSNDLTPATDGSDSDANATAAMQIAEAGAEPARVTATPEEPASADAGANAATPAPAETEPPPIDPESLARSFYAYFEEQGADAAVAALPALESWLDGIALSRRDEASRWFASLVTDVPGLPDPVVTKLVEYFGWLSDYRSAAVLGHDRLEALRARASRAGLLPMRDPAVLHRFRRLRWLDAAQQQGRSWLATLIALSCDGRDRDRWTNVEFAQRRAMGLNTSGAIDDALDRSGRVRARMLWITLYVLTIIDPLARDGDRLTTMAAFVVPMLIATFADSIIAEILRNGGDRLPRPPGPWRWSCALALPLLSALALQWIPAGRLAYLAVVAGSIPAILLGWASTRHWRSVPMIQAAAGTWALASNGFDPLLSWCGCLAVALAYAAIADLKSDRLHALARVPLRGWLPSTGLGWLWAVLFIKVVALMLVLIPLAVTPFVSLLQAERHGMRFALLTLGSAVALAGALHFDPNAAALLLLAAPWLSGFLQRSIQRALDRWAQTQLEIAG